MYLIIYITIAYDVSFGEIKNSKNDSQFLFAR